MAEVLFKEVWLGIMDLTKAERRENARRKNRKMRVNNAGVKKIPAYSKGRVSQKVLDALRKLKLGADQDEMS